MAYVATNPPRCIVTAQPGGGNNVWYYKSEDVHTDVDATDYFANGHALGMRVDDLVFVVKTTATVGATLHTVSVSTAGGAATLSPAILA
jgi:hypothetical protein